MFIEALDFVFTVPQGRLWALLHVFWWATKMWASTCRILFYLICKIISEFYISINQEIYFIANDTSSDGKNIRDFVLADYLKKLRNQHALVYRCVAQLNVCFGHFLLIDITFIFLTEINTAMYTLEALFSEAIDWLHVLGNLPLMIYWIANFSIVCLSSHQIENEVSTFI